MTITTNKQHVEKLISPSIPSNSRRRRVTIFMIPSSPLPPPLPVSSSDKYPIYPASSLKGKDDDLFIIIRRAPSHLTLTPYPPLGGGTPGGTLSTNRT
jgi:hypothetical protein